MLALVFPPLDPVAVQLGPLVVRWYALAYVGGFLLGSWLIGRLNRTSPVVFGKDQLDGLMTWMVVGVILGGRLGYVLFYQFAYYLDHPGDILKVWHGGMSFHGGFLGVLAATAWFCRRHALSFLQVTDLLAVATPIGLFLGRIANFINGELYGRVTDAPWGVIFPSGGPEPRHPSQLYEAGLEGLVLFAVLFWLARGGLRARTGALSGVFLIGYGLARIVVENFRMPDEQLGFVLGPLTMGQLLSVPMLLLGGWLLHRGRRHVAA